MTNFYFRIRNKKIIEDIEKDLVWNDEYKNI